MASPVHFRERSHYLDSGNQVSVLGAAAGAKGWNQEAGSITPGGALPFTYPIAAH
jgi:hypothetical protein